MAERDRFELDLADALRAYAEDAPTEVRPTELARQFAAAYPHRRTAIGPWRLAAVLRAGLAPAPGRGPARRDGRRDAARRLAAPPGAPSRGTGGRVAGVPVAHGQPR